MIAGVFIGLGNAFLAVSGFVLALFFMFGALCLLLRIYLSFEGFVAAQLFEDALGYRADPDGVDVFHEPENDRERL